MVPTDVARIAGPRGDLAAAGGAKARQDGDLRRAGRKGRRKGSLMKGGEERFSGALCRVLDGNTVVPRALAPLLLLPLCCAGPPPDLTQVSGTLSAPTYVQGAA